MTTDAVYPNARARLLRSRSAPGTSTVEIPIVISLRGNRFRVVDETGRAFAELLQDVESARGFGSTPRSMEAFMDASAGSQRGAVDSTILSGNTATGEGEIREAGRAPWAIDAGRIAPIAEQILWADADSAFEKTGTAIALGRKCIEYRRVLEGDEDGYRFRTMVRVLVSDQFVLLREFQDEANPRLAVIVETVDLQHDVVNEDEF